MTSNISELVAPVLEVAIARYLKRAEPVIRKELLKQAEALASSVSTLSGMLVSRKDTELFQQVVDNAGEVSPKALELIAETFQAYGLSVEKFAALFQFTGYEPLEAVTRYMKASAQQNPSSTPDNEAFKAAILARMLPEFDVLAD